jgi:hypothetical protein
LRVIGVREMIRIMEDEGPPTEEFDRSFVLFLLATILAPQPKEAVHVSYYFFLNRNTAGEAPAVSFY